MIDLANLMPGVVSEDEILEGDIIMTITSDCDDRSGEICIAVHMHHSWPTCSIPFIDSRALHERDRRERHAQIK